MDVRIILLPKRELPPTIKANEARSPRKLFVVTLITKIQCIPHSAFQKEVESQGNCEKTDSTVQETPEPWLVTKSIWKRAEEFNPFSEVSKELFTSMGNTEHFDLCEIFSNIQCPDCVFYIGQLASQNSICGKNVQSSEKNRQLNKVRYDVLSISGWTWRFVHHQFSLLSNEAHAWIRRWGIFATIRLLQKHR